jgi:hypothetical protein
MPIVKKPNFIQEYLSIGEISLTREVRNRDVKNLTLSRTELHGQGWWVHPGRVGVR